MMQAHRRIHALDALRAFTLFGVLIAHTANYYGYWRNPELQTHAALVLGDMVHGRFMPVFCMLFGCSFHLILNNPRYSTRRFVWRCLLLVAIGFAARWVYNQDVLMAYGLSGVALATFRHSKTSGLPWMAALLYAAALVIKALVKPDMLMDAPFTGVYRYTVGATLASVLDFGPKQIVKSFLTSMTEHGFVQYLALMLAGYWIARVGIIYRLRDYARPGWIALFYIIHIVFSGIYLGLYTTHWPQTAIIGTHQFANISAALAYSLTFLWVYYRHQGARLWRPVCAYGRCALTNYVSADCAGVVLFTTLYITGRCGFTTMAAMMLGVYALQAALSTMWLHRHRYGPVEGIWRRLTMLA